MKLAGGPTVTSRTPLSMLNTVAGVVADITAT